MLTSGTTGIPKRVPLKARSFEKMLIAAMAYEGDRDPDAPPQLRKGVQLLQAPFAHISGLWAVVAFALAGRRACLLPKFTVAGFVDAVRRHRLKVGTAPPSAIRMIMDAEVSKEDLSSLLVFRTGTAPLDPDLAEAFLARFGIPVLSTYGATEFAGAVAGWSLADFKVHGQIKRGSVGRMNAGIDARIRNPDTNELVPFGTAGLLELRAPHLGDGEWIRTTDLGVLDADGFLWINGRYDNAIIRGGFKIFPDDLVRAMEQHPAIREASVVALPDPRLGQVPAAAYIARANAKAPSEVELREFLRERLLPYQIPVHLREVEELPRTPSMKVSQPALLAMFTQ
jgi:acyl-coenzyme A synthetase/AMP-(fatty) acid ligase